MVEFGESVHFRRVGENNALRGGDQRVRHNSILHFASFLFTPFEEYAINSFLFSTSFLSNLHFFNSFEHFFEEVSESNPILHFGSFLSGRTRN